MSIKRQSRRDFPWGSMRNGIIDVNKCQSEERKGNLFLLLCIANSTEGSMKLQDSLKHNSSKWKKMLKFIKLYLLMEEWFHDCNDKEEVNQTRPLIAKVLKMLQWLFRWKSSIWIHYIIEKIKADLFICDKVLSEYKQYIILRIIDDFFFYDTIMSSV